MRKLLTVIAVAAGLAVGVPATSSAGGWVVVSLDSLPAIHAGEDTEVGFTVLRHGVTPESSDDLAIVVSGTNGQQRFEAVQEGATGHHVATINLADEGQYHWSVTSISGFVTADLGTLDVAASSGGATTWTWDVAQWGGATLAVVLAGLAAVDVRRTRRDRRAAPVPT